MLPSFGVWLGWAEFVGEVRQAFHCDENLLFSYKPWKTKTILLFDESVHHSRRNKINYSYSTGTDIMSLFGMGLEIK